MTHVELGGPDEINGNLIALNALGGIPFTAIEGYRAPYLNYSAELLTNVAKAGFTYDSSATASIPVNENGTDAFWPYTLDNGLANDCLTFDDICSGRPKLPGFWEIPMYAIFDQRGGEGTHLMDPWLDGSNDNVSTWMKNTFAAHCTLLFLFLQAHLPDNGICLHHRQCEQAALRSVYSPYPHRYWISRCGRPNKYDRHDQRFCRLGTTAIQRLDC